MKKIKLCGVSLYTLLAATGANAAGYTCEELIEYTSCMPGYYLNTIDDRCPEGWIYITGVCDWTASYDNVKWNMTEAECAEEDSDAIYRPAACLDAFGFIEGSYAEGVTVRETNGSSVVTSCNECPVGYSCAGGTNAMTECVAGTYQPDTAQSLCLTTPAGNYSGAGAAQYTACSTGTYQPQSGQTSCLDCPAGSYCGSTGLSAVSGICAIGSYSGSNAIECDVCPDTGLTDINGEVVVATTASAGATSISACIIDSNAQFKNEKGTYHYKSECSYDNFGASDGSGAFYIESPDGTCPTGYTYITRDYINSEGTDMGGCPDDPLGYSEGCYILPDDVQDPSSCEYWYNDDGCYGTVYCDDWTTSIETYF